jgi:hypothetical protein
MKTHPHQLTRGGGRNRGSPSVPARIEKPINRAD